MVGRSIILVFSVALATLLASMVDLAYWSICVQRSWTGWMAGWLSVRWGKTTDCGRTSLVLALARASWALALAPGLMVPGPGLLRPGPGPRTKEARCHWCQKLIDFMFFC